MEKLPSPTSLFVEMKMPRKVGDELFQGPVCLWFAVLGSHASLIWLSDKVALEPKEAGFPLFLGRARTF